MKKFLALSLAAGVLSLAPTAGAASAAVPCSPGEARATVALTDLYSEKTGARAPDLSKTEARVARAVEAVHGDPLPADSTAVADSCGRVIFEDTFEEHHPESEASKSPKQARAKRTHGALPSAAPAENPPEDEFLFPASETFKLNSHPQAERTIYLEFQGLATVPAYWRSYGNSAAPAPAFDLDGKPGFSPEELKAIQHVWRGVADYFSPFEVNVTTEKPAEGKLTKDFPGDPEWGVVNVISEHTPIQDRCRCAGVATFNAVNWDLGDFNHYNYSWTVDTQSVGRTASVIAHEVGHTFGLSHHGLRDGDGYHEYYEGNGYWRPLMGTGFGVFHQWSDGSYPGATNTGQRDLSVLNRSLPFAGDDHGDRLEEGSPLTAGRGAGWITPGDDRDFFKVQVPAGAGLSKLTVASGPHSGLMVQARLYSAAGELLSTASDDTEVTRSREGYTPATILQPLREGTYYLEVGSSADFLGRVPSSYGSLGSYSVEYSPGQPTPEPLELTMRQGIYSQLVSTPSTLWATHSVSGGHPPYRVELLTAAEGVAVRGLDSLEFSPTRALQQELTLRVTDSLGATRLGKLAVEFVDPTRVTEPVITTPADLGTHPASVGEVRVPLTHTGGTLAGWWGQVGEANGHLWVDQDYFSNRPELVFVYTGDGVQDQTLTVTARLTTGQGAYEHSALRRFTLTFRGEKGKPEAPKPPAPTPDTPTPSDDAEEEDEAKPVPPLAAKPKFATKAKLKVARVKKKYRAVLRTSAPASWRLVRGKLPPGVKWKQVGKRKWVLTGKPKKAGLYRFTVRVENAGGSSVRTFKLRVRKR